jgi:hypothetical protein
MTARELAARMRGRARAFEPEFRRTTNSLAIEALRFCRVRMTDLIYAQPIPKRPISGKPMWKRTGFLRRAERVEIRDAYTAVVINDAIYALFRHEAGKPGRRKTRFPAHWHDELRAVLPEMTRTAYRDAVRKVLTGGRL